jgi:hypothetical protein
MTNTQHSDLLLDNLQKAFMLDECLKGLIEMDLQEVVDEFGSVKELISSGMKLPEIIELIVAFLRRLKRLENDEVFLRMLLNMESENKDEKGNMFGSMLAEFNNFAFIVAQFLTAFIVQSNQLVPVINGTENDFKP